MKVPPPLTDGTCAELAPRTAKRRGSKRIPSSSPPWSTAAQPGSPEEAAQEQADKEQANEAAAGMCSIQRAAQDGLARMVARRLVACVHGRMMLHQQDLASNVVADLLSRYALGTVEREVLLPEAVLDLALKRDGHDAAALAPGVVPLKVAVLQTVQVWAHHRGPPVHVMPCHCSQAVHLAHAP